MQSIRLSQPHTVHFISLTSSLRSPRVDARLLAHFNRRAAAGR